MKRLPCKIAVARGSLSDDPLQAALAQLGREPRHRGTGGQSTDDTIVALGHSGVVPREAGTHRLRDSSRLLA